MRKFLLSLLVCFLVSSVCLAAPKTPLKKHALARIVMAPAKATASVVTHPLTSLKKVAGTVLFAVEPAVDIAHMSFAALDGLSSSEQYWGVVHKVFHEGLVISAAADTDLEKAEDFLFGSSN